MANKIFDRDTLLDLTVNVVPLFIIAFFIVAFAVISPFGMDPMASSIQFGLLVVPFVLLAVLTYFAGQAVAGSEMTGEVYLPGQASVEGAEPLEHESDSEAGDADAEPKAVEDAEGGDTDADEDDAADTDEDDAGDAAEGADADEAATDDGDDERDA
ncbi:DUF6684 family protein [Halobellus sp. GM3]|uniref:DUF6684 family protein n=1 Tax=Halobellus sp. GM3 TaxID=3458410 RepID=UPI00403E1936